MYSLLICQIIVYNIHLYPLILFGQRISVVDVDGIISTFYTVCETAVHIMPRHLGNGIGYWARTCVYV